MNKRGFTLAEVLIALAIIGVIAAITLPTFLSSTQNQSNAAKLATCINSLENAFTKMMAQEGVDDLSDTSWAESGYSNSVLADHLKITPLESGKTNAEFYTAAYGAANPYKTISGGTAGLGNEQAFQMNNGAYVMISSTTPSELNETTVANAGGTVSKRVMHMYIDVNGKTQPNVWGRDAHTLRVDASGSIYGVGSLNASLLDGASSGHWSTATNEYGCNGTIKSLGCTGRLMENNYKMDY